jgi:hypothetical protein
MKISHILPAVLIMMTSLSCGSSKLQSTSQKAAKVKAKEWSKQGYQTMGSGVARIMLEDFYVMDRSRDEETGYPKYLTTEVVGINSNVLDVALQEAIDVATARIATQIQSKIQAKSTRDVNNSDGQAYTKYLNTATTRTQAKLSGGQVVYKVYRETRKGYEVTLGYTYSFERAIEMFRQEMLQAMESESESFKKQAEAEFMSGIGDF